MDYMVPTSMRKVDGKSIEARVGPKDLIMPTIGGRATVLSIDFNKARFNVKWAGDDSGEAAFMAVSDLPGAKVVRLSAPQIDSGGVFAGFQVPVGDNKWGMETLEEWVAIDKEKKRLKAEADERENAAATARNQKREKMMSDEMRDRTEAHRALQKLARSRALDDEKWHGVGHALGTVSYDLMHDWAAWSRANGRKQALAACTTAWSQFRPFTNADMPAIVMVRREGGGGKGGEMKRDI